MSFFKLFYVLTRTQVHYLSNEARFNKSIIVIAYNCSVAGKIIHLVFRKTAPLVGNCMHLVCSCVGVSSGFCLGTAQPKFS